MKDRKANWKRILLGLVVVFLAGNVAQYLLPVYDSQILSGPVSVDSFVSGFVAIAYVMSFFIFAIGGLIAQRGFTIPAVIYAAAEWLHGMYLGIKRAVAFDSEQIGNSMSAGDMFAATWPDLLPGLLVHLAVATAGSFVGMKVFEAVWSTYPELEKDRS